MKKTLTVKQKRFIDFYDGNGLEAARKAGYKGSYSALGAIASENLRKPYIAEAIAAREKDRKSEYIADREERQRFWTAGMRGQIEGVDPVRCSELLGKSEADFIERRIEDHTHRIRKVELEFIRPGDTKS